MFNRLSLMKKLLMLVLLLFGVAINLPASTSAAPEPLTLSQAFLQGQVEGQIHRQADDSPYSAILTLRRVVADDLTLTVPQGSLLLHEGDEAAHLVVYALQGRLTETGSTQATETIQLQNETWQEYKLTVFSLDFQQAEVDLAAEFVPIDPLPSEVVSLLAAAAEQPDLSLDTLQVSIWAITAAVDRTAIMQRGYDFDLETLHALFTAANLDPTRKRLFDDSSITTPQGYVTRGNTYYELGEYTQALADYSQAIALDSTYLEAFFRRGFTRLQQQDISGAMTDFSKITDLSPQHPLGHFALGMAYNAEADPDYNLVLHHLSQAINLGLDSVTAFQTRGLAYAATGQFDQAIVDFSQAIRRDPDALEAYVARAKAYHANRDARRAIEDYNRAIDLAPEFAPAYRDRGQSYAALGQEDRAIQDWQAYLRLQLEAPDRSKVEGWIAALQEVLPTPESGQMVSLVDALEQGWVEAEFYSLGVSSGDSVRLTIRRILPQELTLAVPLGTRLLGQTSALVDVVVRQLRGQVVSETAFQPTNSIHLTDDQSHDYILEAYTLELQRVAPRLEATFTLGGQAEAEIVDVLRAVNQFPQIANNIPAIQTAIWVVGDNVNQTELRTQLDVQMVQMLLQTAGLEPGCYRFFAGQPCATSETVTVVPVVQSTQRATPPPAPLADCPDPNARITVPRMGVTVRGRLQVLGTANIPNFHFYKVQYRADDRTDWGELYKNDQPVVDGQLMEWHTNTVPPGVYWLRLIVEDPTGNYVEPCEVKVVISR